MQVALDYQKALLNNLLFVFPIFETIPTLCMHFTCDECCCAGWRAPGIEWPQSCSSKNIRCRNFEIRTREIFADRLQPIIVASFPYGIFALWTAGVPKFTVGQWTGANKNQTHPKMVVCAGRNITQTRKMTKTLSVNSEILTTHLVSGLGKDRNASCLLLPFRLETSA